MSATLIESEGFYVTLFWGGVKRGVCIQIMTPDQKFIQLTLAQFRMMQAVRLPK
jgi:hypothetical protein